MAIDNTAQFLSGCFIMQVDGYYPTSKYGEDGATNFKSRKYRFSEGQYADLTVIIAAVVLKLNKWLLILVHHMDIFADLR